MHFPVVSHTLVGFRHRDSLQRPKTSVNTDVPGCGGFHHRVPAPPENRVNTGTQKGWGREAGSRLPRVGSCSAAEDSPRPRLRIGTIHSTDARSLLYSASRVVAFSSPGLFLSMASQISMAFSESP